MAKEEASKKRKASVPESSAIKMKKVKKVTIEAPVASPKVEKADKKRKATEDVAPVAIKKSKKKAAAADLPETEKVPKGASTEETIEKPENKLASTKKTSGKKSKSEKLESTKARILVDEKAMSEEAEDVEDIEEVDDQTEALLKGFESDSDGEQDKKEEAFEEGAAVGKIPNQAKKALKKSKKAAAAAEEDKPGVVYIGRIPHGFYENEMREYFKQFGTILAIRMARNTRTGSSKHFAFVKFESAVVAEIVAKTMDNYLLFNHILKVKLMQDDQVHEDTFKGANKRFKKVPWSKIEGRKLEQGVSEKVWEKRIAKENKRRTEKAEKMKEIGYTFEAPEIKSAEGVSVRFAPAVEVVGTQDAVTEEPVPEASFLPVLPTPEEAKIKAVETAAVVSKLEKSKPAKAKMEKANTKTVEPTKAATSAPNVPATVEPKAKKQKTKKGVPASEDVPEIVAVVTEETTEVKKTRGDRGRKPKAEGVEGAAPEASSKLKRKRSKSKMTKVGE